jgi:hypothetical protein
MYDFDLVPFVERGLVVIGTGHYLKIESYGDMGARDIQLFKHLGNGPTGLQIFFLPVDDELHSHLKLEA